MKLELATRVVAAELYPDRARLSREGTVDVPVGRCSVRVSGLPMAADVDTFRASGSGAATARLLGVRAEVEEFVETPSEQVSALQRDLEAAQDEVALIAARLGILERDGQHLDALAAQAETFARGLALRERSVEQQGAVFDFLQNRRLELQTRIADTRRDQRAAERKADLLKRRLAQASSGARRQRRVAVIDLDVSVAGALTLAVAYVVNGAGWEPRYDLRVVDALIEWRYLASVHQTTGEDWSDVALTLSTAQPALSLRVPELDPWPIAPLQPPVMRKAMQASRAAEMPQGVEFFAQAMPASAPAPAPVLAEAAEVQDAGVAVNFRLPSRADVPGGGEPRTVTIAEFPLKPRWDYAAAPRRTPAAFRRARIVNETPYTWLPGPVSLFEGDTYLGPTELEFVARGQEAELYLGVDDRIRVEAEPTQRDVDKTLFGDKRRVRIGMCYEIENLRDGAVTVLVRDHIPLSRHEQITVKLETAEPKPASHDDMGLLTWEVDVPAKGKREIRVVFVVEHPRSMTVTGLPS